MGGGVTAAGAAGTGVPTCGATVLTAAWVVGAVAPLTVGTSDLTAPSAGPSARAGEARVRAAPRLNRDAERATREESLFADPCIELA